ncbi:hypothetical protein DH2020_039336 [Rehmannia glutinosa]|uniref:RNase H type-1 domain-containing protein n=1 Tax=Rehmannia glutinosa TaxID=99300 RepID=A0ABR0UWL6_REHGL
MNTLETIQHLFMQNDQVIRVWNHFAAWLRFSPPHTEHIHIFFSAWKNLTPFAHTPHISVLLPCIILWKIWSERNNCRHNMTKFSHFRIITNVHSHLSLFSKAKLFQVSTWKGFMDINTKLGFTFKLPTRHHHLSVLWTPPTQPWLKLNVDASFKSQSRAAGIGGVARDYRGETIWAFSSYLSQAQDPLFAECKAREVALSCNYVKVSNIYGLKLIR